jgi:hypothetical protein
MDASPSFTHYREFLPYYVAMHSLRATRRLHLAGSLGGLILAFAGLMTGKARWLLAWPAFGYAAAWPAHWLIEKNNPASFGHPLWSLRGDLEMAAMMLRGRDNELALMARDYLRANPDRRTCNNWPLQVVAA